MVSNVADHVLSMLQSLEQVPGPHVNQLQHALQTATRAERAGADLDLTVAALCHDIGKVFNIADHALLSAEILRPYVDADATWVVEFHQDFVTPVRRNGAINTRLRRRHRGRRFYVQAVQFADEWDLPADDPGYSTFPLAHFEPMVREVFGRVPQVPWTSRAEQWVDARLRPVRLVLPPSTARRIDDRVHAAIGLARHLKSRGLKSREQAGAGEPGSR